MTTTLYNKYLLEQLKGSIDLANDTIKVMLLDSAYTPDFDTHLFIDDVSANEVSGAGYTAGGKTLVSKVVSQDNTNDRGLFDAADLEWTNSTITARYAVIYKDTGVAGTSPLIALIDFGADEVSDSGSFKIIWNTAGIIANS